MANMVEILISAKDLAAPAFARSRAEMARLQADAERQSAAASAAMGRRQALEMERERLYAAERASIARRAAGETTRAERAAEQEQIALARRANSQQLAAQRTLEREQVASARRASAEVAAAQREQAAGARAAASKVRTAMTGIVVAAAAVGVESVRMASKFDASMTLLHTQAGVANDQMGVLKKGVLDLAGKVGQDPDSLAESLFHVESNFESMGITSSKALKLVETAAKGATVGHADLVDVTNALTAAVASGIPGVENMDQAMGVLNATVGVGDMKMQDLADAFGSGMVATVKGFGLSITDVGAALAVFGDNNIRGSLAGNQLRMSVMALAKPVSTAGDALKKLGLTQTTLRDDMQRGGLKLALTDLVDRMHKAGISAKEQGGIITEAFGRKAGAGLNILVGQFDRLQSKYPALEKGAKGFGQSWADTQKTFAFQMKQLQGQFDSLMIKIGLKVIPVVQKFMGFLTELGGSGAGDALKSMGEEGGAAFDALGGALKVAAPFLTELAHGFQAILEYFTPFISEVGKVGSAIADALFPAKSGKDLGGPFTRLLELIRQNKGAIQEAARQFGQAVMGMTEAAVSSLPLIMKMFRTLGDAALVSLGVLVDGAAKAFGWVPGVGSKLKSAAKAFDSFRDSALEGLAKADRGAQDFTKGALPRLAKARLKLNISDWEDQIKTAKSQLTKVPSARNTYLKAQIKDLQAKVDSAKQKLSTLKDKTTNLKARDQASGKVSLLQRMLNSLHDKTVTVTTFLTYKGHSIAAQSAGRMATGGVVRGPGTDTSDDVPIMASNDEFVVNAKSSRKHRTLLEAINDDKVQAFAKGGSVSKSERDARKTLQGEFGISYFGRLAGYKRTPFEHGLAAPSDLSALVEALNKAASEIKAATHGRTERHLLKELDSTGKALIKHEQALSKVNASLDKAKSKLDDLKNSASQLSDSVKSGILSAANITQGNAGQTVTVASVMGGLTQSRDQATAFAGALKGLKSKGLSSSLIQQIAEAGINGGGLETAGALLGASSSEIASINSLQSQINKAAGSAGKTTSGAVYGAAIKAQTAAVNKLRHSQEALQKSMDKLAKSMEKLVEKAVGKKAAGGIVGAAASGGVRGGLTWVGEREPELLELPVGSRVHSGPDSRRMAAAAGGRREPVVIELRSSGSEVDEFLLKILRRAINVRGGNAQVVLTGRRS